MTEKKFNAKQWIVVIQADKGNNFIRCDTFEESLEIQQKRKTNDNQISIYTKIPCQTPMSITTPQAKQLYTYLHGKTDLPNLLQTLIDELRYCYPDIEKKKL